MKWTHTNIDMPKTFPEKFGEVNCVWVPRTFYDNKFDKCMLYWSMRHNNDPVTYSISLGNQTKTIEISVTVEVNPVLDGYYADREFSFSKKVEDIT
jgi:hypothetical protein